MLHICISISNCNIGVLLQDKIVGKPIWQKNIQFQFKFSSFCCAAITANDCDNFGKDKRGKILAAVPNISKFDWYQIVILFYIFPISK